MPANAAYNLCPSCDWREVLRVQSCEMEEFRIPSTVADVVQAGRRIKEPLIAAFLCAFVFSICESLHELLGPRHNQFMLRQKWGSVVCPSCGNLVGVQDQQCLTCGRWNPGLWGYAPLLSRLGRDLGFSQFVMWSCIILYLLSLVLDPRGVRAGGMLSFLSPSVESLFLFGASGSVPVFGYGRWWTVLTAGWLHAGLLHIFFNMMWIRQLAPDTSEMYGASRMVIIYTIAGIVGFAASTIFGGMFPFLPGFVRGAGFTVGASAPIFGLLGALVYYGRRTGSRIVGDQAKSWAMMLLIFGFIMPGVDNWAHLGGFAGGYAAGKFLDPLRPERPDHLIGALVCLALTGIAIALSIVYGLPVLRPQ